MSQIKKSEKNKHHTYNFTAFDGTKLNVIIPIELLSKKSNLNKSESVKVIDDNDFLNEEASENDFKQAINREEISVCNKCNTALMNKNSCLTWLSTRFCAITYYWGLIGVTLAIGSIVAIGCIGYNISLLKVNRSYFSFCKANTDCDITLGLYCAVLNGTCNCPANYVAGRCSCLNGYYWNGTMCAVLLNYLETGCLFDYNCNSKQNLICSSNTCLCKNGQMWNATLTKCAYGYLGCFWDTGLTLYYNFVGAVQNNSNLNYFVDVCISHCFISAYKYAHIAIGTNSSINICYCRSTYNTTTVNNNCDTTCLGIDGNQYMCGSSSGNSNQRSIYQVS